MQLCHVSRALSETGGLRNDRESHVQRNMLFRHLEWCMRAVREAGDEV